MRKGTKKNIIHGILIIFVIIFALIASIVAAFRDVTVQSMVARSIAGTLSEKLNTVVKIKTFYITEKLVVCIEDMQINDLEGYPMFMIGRLDAKIIPILSTNEIWIRDIYLKDVLGRVVKYEGEKRLNIMEIVAQLNGNSNKNKDKTETDDGNGIHLRIDNMQLDNGHVVYWNQNKDKPEKLIMDYAHIDIDSIYGKFSNLEMYNDTVLGIVHTLRGKDKCGLPLDDASGKVLFCEKSLTVDNLILKTNQSHVDLDLRFEYEKSSAYFEFVNSVHIKSNIRKSTIVLSDLQYFCWTLRKMPDRFDFTANYDGFVREFTVTDFVADFGNESHIDLDVSFAGLPDFFNSYMDINIKELSSTYDDTKNFAIPVESQTVPMPEMLAGIGRYSLSGTYQGSASDFKTNFNLVSEMGDIDAQIYVDATENVDYSFIIDANNLKINDLIGMQDHAEVSLNLDMNGHGMNVEDADFEADLNIKRLNIYGNEFEDWTIHGDLENKRFIALSDVRQQYLDADLSTMIDFTGDKPSYNIITKINNADLVNLNMLDSDSIMLLATNIDLQFSGTDIDDITGHLDISKTRYFNGEEFLMDKFSANISEMSGIKDVTVDCDFFRFYGYGIVKAKTFVNALKNTAKRYVDIPVWFANTVPDVDKQEFSVSMELKDTEMLSRLFMPTLYVSSGTTINATYTDGYSYHGSTIESDEIVFNGLKFKGIDVRNTAKFDDFVSKIDISDIILRDTTETNPDAINLENVVLISRCGDDLINFDLSWDDNDRNDHNKAMIKSTFTPHPNAGGLLTIRPELILVNDTVWSMHPDCNINFQKHETGINNLELYTDNQLISVHGVYPNTDADTLYVDFQNLDISDFDFITKGNNLNFDGYLNGFVGLSGLNGNLSFSADIDLQSLNVNGQEVGDVLASAKWYDPKESIFINLIVYNTLFSTEQKESIGMVGFYYPRKKNDNLSFDLFFNDFKLETVSPFVSKEDVDRIGGLASGNLGLRGSLSEPEIFGNVKLKNAGCEVKYINSYYSINNDIKLEKNKIVFENIIVQDSLGNTAEINGAINHNHLKDFDFDLNLTCDDFLGLNIPPENANGFYGTAVADGTVSIKGPVDDINMNIDVVTQKGTVIDVPLSGTSSVDNNFVVFVQDINEPDTVVEQVMTEIEKKDSSFKMNLDAEVNPDALVNIYLPESMGSISARGNGNINIGLTPNDFELRGDYLIISGSFVFKLEMVRRTFTLRRGGTLRWTGDPTDADINIVGVYRTKSSLTSLGTQAVDSSALTNNINVDCIIRLTDKLMNPTITFGIELPNATEDTRNTVYSVIDTTNQAVMAQQVFSLMVLGSFSNTAGSNIARFGTTAGYSVITNQLSNWLSQISKDFDIGISYTPNDNVTNEELEVALSTQLFDDRLTIEGNFGVIRGNKNDANNANNIVGDVDLSFRLTNRLSLKAYNHTNIRSNYYYSFENYSDFTQGVGISFSQSFDNIREIFHYNNKNKKTKKPKLKLNNESKP
ncbi:MAG: translocation/assembly module TamB [Bacteroidales bacterium]|nr:translocation/assembly module TamB [Bacteroidales bacterium]